MIKATDILLTTKDNPFNPFTQYDDWKQYDQDYGFNTESYCMRVYGFPTIDETDDEKAKHLLRTYSEIISMNNELGFDVYYLITRDGTKLDSIPDYLRED